VNPGRAAIGVVTSRRLRLIKGGHVADSRRSKTSSSRSLVLDLPGEAAARALAQEPAQKSGRDIVISDCDDFELRTIRPRLNS
jgi:hypothetical protein